MGLSCGELLPSDGRSISNAYCLILTTHILAAFRCVGSGDVGVCDVTPGPRNDRVDIQNITMNAENGVVRVRNVATDVKNGCVDIRNGWMCVYPKFSLGPYT